MRSRPPSPFRILAAVVIPARHREFVLGDLDEMFARRAARFGRRTATFRYLLDTLASAFAGLRPRRGRALGSEMRAPGSGGPSPLGKPRVGILSDVRLALRWVRREVGLVTLAVITLALGVGSSAAVFGMVDQLLLRPLPGVRDGRGAAYLQFRSIEEPERTQGRGIATLDFDDLRRSATLLSGIASFGNVSLKVSVGNARPIRVHGNTIYGDFFETLGAWPVAGRLLRASETELGADPLKAVISEDLARKLFGSVEAAPGRTLRMNDEMVAVVGVVGGGFAGAERGIQNDVWLPYGALVPLVGFAAERLLDRNSVMHSDIIVRPRPGVSADAIRDQAGEILRRLGLASTESGPYLAKLRPWVFEGLHTPPIVRRATYSSLRMLTVVVGLVLLLACANVANLLLFRNVRRRGMVATLRALGASTGRIARLHLALSLVIGSLGALVGIGVGWVISVPFKGASLMRMPAFEGLVLDWRALAFAIGASGITTLVFGTLPALVAGRFDLAGSLRSSTGTDSGHFVRVRSALSAIQLSLGMALLVGALLLLRTMQNLYSVDLGIDSEGISALTLDLPRDLGPEDQQSLVRRLLATAGRLPEVKGAAADPYGPFGPSLIGRIRLPGAPEADELRADVLPVTPGWFELLGVRTVRGRTFRDTDWNVGTTDIVILTESLARRLFGRIDVVGQVVEAGFGPPAPMEILGVVSDVRSAHAPDRPEDTFFVTPPALPWALPYFTLLLDVQAFNPEVAQRIRTAVEAELPDEPVPDPEPIAERLDYINAEAAVYTTLLALLSTIAVVLSAVGLYGVVAFTVAARQREFGVRLALGAEGGRIARLVAQNVSGILGAGTVLGLGAAFALSQLLQNRLFGVEPLDPASYAGAAAVFAAVAIVACSAPTLRAIRVDPVTTLREE
jgi:predicted permease